MQMVRGYPRDQQKRCPKYSIATKWATIRAANAPVNHRPAIVHVPKWQPSSTRRAQHLNLLPDSKAHQCRELIESRTKFVVAIFKDGLEHVVDFLLDIINTL
jgi:hypothetical protein